MKNIKIVIEKSADYYSSYAQNAEGIYGAGETVEEAKQSALKAIQLLKKYNSVSDLPPILKGDFSISFKYDVESFLNYYKGIFTNAALERITGINQKQINHYANGLKKPRPAQVKKIETALHQLGNELIALEL